MTTADYPISASRIDTALAPTLRAGPGTDGRGDPTDGAGPYCAMEIVSREEADERTSAFPSSVAQFLAGLVQDVNDSICEQSYRPGMSPTETPMLCGACAREVYKLAQAVRGTSQRVTKERLFSLWIVLLTDPTYGLYGQLDLSPKICYRRITQLAGMLSGEILPTELPYPEEEIRELRGVERSALYVVDRLNRDLMLTYRDPTDPRTIGTLSMTTESVLSWMLGDIAPQGPDCLAFGWWVVRSWKAITGDLDPA